MLITDDIKILSCDRGWMVVEKPCGISVHNDPGNDLLSMLEQKLAREPDTRKAMDIHQKSFQIKPAHRLDQDTSGVILLTTDDDVLRRFRNAFEQGSIRKQYIALVHGNFPEFPEEDNVGIWDYPLTRNAGGRRHPEGTGKKSASKTCFQVLNQSTHYALLLVELITGRQHQIRRHAALAGHPVTADHRYGSPRSLDFLKNQQGYTRLGLHAFSLEIPPWNEMPSLKINSPGIPGEMVRLLREDGIPVE